jgi:hypothetical protein
MIQIRLATDDDGPRIAGLLAASGFTIDGLDWSEVYPYWLVSEEGGAITGCVQIVMGRPIGGLERLSLDPDMGRRAKARTVKALVSHGAALLKGFGAQVAMGMVPDELAGYLKVLRHRGARDVGHGIVMAKRL